MSFACWVKGYIAGNGLFTSDKDVKAVCEKEEKSAEASKEIKDRFKKFIEEEVCVKSGFGVERCQVSTKAAEQLSLLKKGNIPSTYLGSFDGREVAWRALQDYVSLCIDGKKCSPITDIAEKIKIYNICLIEEGIVSEPQNALIWAGLYMQELDRIGAPEVLRNKFHTY